MKLVMVTMPTSILIDVSSCNCNASLDNIVHGCHTCNYERLLVIVFVSRKGYTYYVMLNSELNIFLCRSSYVYNEVHAILNTN